MRTAAEFRDAALARGIVDWPTHRCTFCGYQCCYVLHAQSDRVWYDAGCYCIAKSRELRTWEHIADRYNMQSRPDIIAAFDDFWGFTPAASCSTGSETP